MRKAEVRCFMTNLMYYNTRTLSNGGLDPVARLVGEVSRRVYFVKWHRHHHSLGGYLLASRRDCISPLHLVPQNATIHITARLIN